MGLWSILERMGSSSRAGFRRMTRFKGFSVGMDRYILVGLRMGPKMMSRACFSPKIRFTMEDLKRVCGLITVFEWAMKACLSTPNNSTLSKVPAKTSSSAT